MISFYDDAHTSNGLSRVRSPFEQIFVCANFKIDVGQGVRALTRADDFVSRKENFERKGKKLNGVRIQLEIRRWSVRSYYVKNVTYTKKNISEKVISWLFKLL